MYREKPGVDDIPVVHATVFIELRFRELLDSQFDQGESAYRFGGIQAVLHELPDGGVQRLTSLPYTGLQPTSTWLFIPFRPYVSCFFN